MSVCPKCGNHIQRWAHGVCYTCKRNQRDYRRFGRRRPGRRKWPAKRTPSKPTGSKNCWICGKKVRANHIKSHLWYAHQLRPYATKEETRRARAAWEQNKKVKSEEKEVISKTKKCPICGCEVPLDLVDAHKVYHQRTKNKAAESKVSASRKFHPDATKSKTERMVKPMLPEFMKVRYHEASPQQMVYGINRLLEDIFECPTRVSQILRKSGISQSNIDIIRQDHLDSYLSCLLDRWLVWWVSILPPACVAILISRYGLPCGPEQESFVTNSLHDLSVSETEQLQTAALASLRKQKHKSRIKQFAVKEAQNILDKSA